jgi:hypothetical protein
MACTNGQTNECFRQLVHVPLIHAPADMGALAGGLEAAYVDRFGRQRWQELLALVDQFWRSVRSGLDGLHLDYSRVNLYQDGLPVCGQEMGIAREAAARGSENHQLLLDLTARGATLMGTEDPALLLEEYRDLRAALATGAAGDEPRSRQADQVERRQQRLLKRDAYIGRRIGESLRPGRIAVLFLGMAHSVEPHLPRDIVVSRLQLDAPQGRGSGPTDAFEPRAGGTTTPPPPEGHKEAKR